jgi:ferredoxin
MIVSELKPMEEILGYLEGEKKVFILGCKGCAEACETGSEAQVAGMKADLEGAGKTVTGTDVLDFLCDKALIKTRLRPKTNVIMESDSVLVMTCGIGVQCVAASIEKLVHPAANTISVGGARGEWWSEERCAQCGDCLLDYTGGICPVTACSKHLINGMCGGSQDGMCEVGENRECGWSQIYDRLKARGRLDKMKTFVPAKRNRFYLPPEDMKSTTRWALEAKPEPVKEETE